MKSSPYHLTSWAKFHQAAKEGKTICELGFPECESKREIVRLGNRYRVAKSFRGVLLEEYTKKTLDGYSALFRLFLAWSVLEQFLEIVELKQKHEETKKLFEDYGSFSLCEKMKEHDSKNTFYEFLLSQVNKIHQAEIEKHFKDEEINASYLISAIRHVFAHGKLTPHSNKSNPHRITKMCDEISEFVLIIVDCEFTKRIQGSGSPETATSHE